MPSHSRLTGPWKIGDFIIGHEQDEKFLSAHSYIFMCEEEVLNTLTMLQKEFGPKGGVWDAVKCGPTYAYMKGKSVPEPFHCMDIWSLDHNDWLFQPLRDYMTKVSLERAAKLFTKSAKIKVKRSDIFRVPFMMQERFGGPYSWIHFFGYELSYPEITDIFKINERATWTVVYELDADELLIANVFANDDKTLMMAKMLS